MSNDKHHSEQLEKYLKGKMSTEEAHAFERDALDDPFTYEALEGLEGQDADKMAADLSKLRVQLNSTNKPQGWGFLQIAASVVLLLAAGLSVWFVYSDNSSEQDELALQEQPKQLQEAPKSRDLSQEITDDKAQAETEVPQVDQVDKISPLRKEAAQEVTSPRTSRIEPASEEPAPALADRTEEEQAVGTKVAPEEMKTQPFSAASARMQKKSVATQSKTIQVTEITEEEIEVALDMQVKDETVIESLSFASASEEAYVLYENRPEPVIGWEAYQIYLADSLRFPPFARRMGIEGKVFVQANLSKSGTIDTAYVVKGIQENCDQEALRLILEGPNFNPDSTARRVIIPVTFDIK